MHELEALAGNNTLLKDTLKALTSNNTLPRYILANFVDGKPQKQNRFPYNTSDAVSDFSTGPSGNSIPMDYIVSSLINKNCSSMQTQIHSQFTSDSSKSTSEPHYSSSNSLDVGHAGKTDPRSKTPDLVTHKVSRIIQLCPRIKIIP